jgi:alpha-glucosidase
LTNKKRWWKEAVGYQIYPASFKDSNNDGIGDLNGIREKLDYLKDLGIDFIWITPIYASPNVDNGYDISNYQEISETFGTMEEFDLLLSEAHAKGIKVIMDLVINHTSDQHRWFIESRKSVNSPYRDYYIWEDGRVDGPPNNWTSIFGGSAWEYDQETNQYYLHVFAKEQPDLNWENPRVQKELFSMIKWWLDKGIDGFRVDAISHIKKLPITNNIVDNPLEAYTNVPGIDTYLKALRDVVKKDNVLTVGEANGVSAQDALQWVGKNGYFNMLFEFEHLSLWSTGKEKGVDVLKLKKALSNWQETLYQNGWNALYMENHDIPRSVSTFGSDEVVFWRSSAKALALTFMFLQGTPFIFQGQEIGMTNMPFHSIEEINAIDTKNFYYNMINTGVPVETALDLVRKSARDNARTPMQWDKTKYAGFSEHKPWLVVNPNRNYINVEDEQKDPDSILNFYKKLIRLRKENKTLIYGSYQLFLPEHPQLYAYERILGEDRFVIIVNLSSDFASADLPPAVRIEDWDLIINNLDDGPLQQHTIFVPYEARVYRKKLR